MANARNKTMFEIIVIIFAAFMFISIAIPLSGCTEAERKSTEISREADEFKTPRKLTIINTRTDKIVLEFIGTFSVQSSSGAIDILCAVGNNKYEKHFFTLNEWTIYVVEDISSNGGDLYYRQIKYYPEKE